MANELVLVTANMKDFKHFNGLAVETRTGACRRLRRIALPRPRRLGHAAAPSHAGAHVIAAERMTDEEKLLEKLRRVEALFSGAATDGERVAAGEARKRIQARLKEVEAADPPIEFRFRISSTTPGREGVHRTLPALRHLRLPLRGPAPHDADGEGFPALRRRDVVARVRADQHDVWKLPRRNHRSRGIAKAIHQDTSEASEVAAKPLLPDASA